MSLEFQTIGLHPGRVRRLGLVALAFMLFVPASVNAAGTSMRAGVFTGYAFDACRAPSTASLQAWAASPYRALGIYIGGMNRACAQPNLTPQWVQDTTRARLEPAAAVRRPAGAVRRRRAGSRSISTTLATAASQGRAAADDAVAKAQALGLPAGSPMWFDMEGYHVGNAACTAAVRAFVSAWDDELRAVGFVPGIYGSAASTIRDVAALATRRRISPGSRTGTASRASSATATSATRSGRTTSASTSTRAATTRRTAASRSTSTATSSTAPSSAGSRRRLRRRRPSRRVR